MVLTGARTGLYIKSFFMFLVSLKSKRLGLSLAGKQQRAAFIVI
nr:MAG TPA: hypothetical protein [Caudoviricetes sp.]